MKRFKSIALIFAATAALAAAGISIDVTNPLDTARPTKVVAVDWNQLLGKIDGLTAKNARVLDSAGKVLISQAVDNDGDGAIDQLLFIAEVGGKETKQFEVKADDSLAIPEIEDKTYARYVPERKDDFAWENDVVAFRAYGPGLRDGVENCGVDCFMKRVKYPIIDKWYKRVDYHLDRGEGYDGYKVGSGLGCGGTAVWSGGEMHKPDVYSTWKQFANGPIRAVFELTYGPWEVDGRLIMEKKRFSLDLGSRLFRVDDAFEADEKPADINVVVGLSTHEGKAKAYENQGKGWIYCWEKIDKFYLGTAVVVPPEFIKDYMLIKTKKKFEGHAVFIVNTGEEGKFHYWAGYGWEKAKEITTREQWQSYIEGFVSATANPVTVTIK